MEEEKFFTGYCRALDSSRTVECLFDGRQLTEVDCRYGSCLYQSTCPIGREISQAEEEARESRQ